MSYLNSLPSKIVLVRAIKSSPPTASRASQHWRSAWVILKYPYRRSIVIAQNENIAWKSVLLLEHPRSSQTYKWGFDVSVTSKLSKMYLELWPMEVSITPISSTNWQFSLSRPHWHSMKAHRSQIKYLSMSNHTALLQLWVYSGYYQVSFEVLI